MTIKPNRKKVYLGFRCSFCKQNNPLVPLSELKDNPTHFCVYCANEDEVDIEKVRNNKSKSIDTKKVDSAVSLIVAQGWKKTAAKKAVVKVLSRKNNISLQSLIKKAILEL